MKSDCARLTLEDIAHDLIQALFDFFSVAKDCSDEKIENEGYFFRDRIVARI